MKTSMLSERKTGLLLALGLSMTYIALTAFQGLYLAVLFLAIPLPGIIGFFYGNWSGEGWLSFLIGFLPVTAYFIAALSPQSFGLAFPAFLLGTCSGMVGYGGARKKKGKVDWFLPVLIGAFAWILLITPGIRS